MKWENGNPGRDPVKYYVSVFGTPANSGTWGWRVEGHHLSVNFTLIDGQVVSSTPAFFGSNPAHVQSGPRKGLAVLAREENVARALVKSLTSEQRSQAILQVEVPSDVITGPGREAQTLTPLGISFTDLNKAQRKNLQQLIRAHVFRLTTPLAREYWKELQRAGWDRVHFAWAGSTERGNGHYYRVQGPTFILEYDNTQNNANHVHCVWRDVKSDFGEDVLRDHYAKGHSGGEDRANALTEAERRAGWQLLFDGTSLNGWRNFRAESLSAGWQVKDGALQRVADHAGDIVTLGQYDNFELQLEYRIEREGNSGVMFHVTEDSDRPWHSGPEIQVQDNEQGHDPQKSGWLYQLYKPTIPAWSRRLRTAAGLENPDVVDATRPAGEWNHVYLRVTAQQCEVAVNGNSYYYFKIGSDEWNERVAASKFAQYPQFGKAGRGHICLQDHGDPVAYRNIKLRRLQADGSGAREPDDGQIDVHPELAFPKLKWEDWAPEDDAGRVRPLRLIELTDPADNAERLFAATQDGVIFRFDNDPQATLATRFLDIRDRVHDWRKDNETGLLGLAFHPKFADNGKFYVSYSSAKDKSTIIAQYQVSGPDAERADPNSERVLLTVPQPFGNHNGGCIEFGPDGYLYIGLGDGGDRNDPLQHGQNLATLLGSILRIDVDQQTQGKAYAIPADNPFVGVPNACPEIYAYGLRNVWRLAFDRVTGRLWAADVGQDLWEEVDIIQAGGNYGWSSREGTHPFGNADPASAGTLVEPIWEYDHRIGKSITGGRVYRSSRLPVLKGAYIYADYVSGKIWALDYDFDQQRVRKNWTLVPGGVPVLAFGEDGNGEVYYLTESARGECIYRFDAGSNR